MEILILLGTCTAKIYDLILVKKTKVFFTNIKSYILALEKKQSFFCTVRGELPFSLKDFVFKTQGIKNSKSFLSVPPLPPMTGGSPPEPPQLPDWGKNAD